MTYRKSIFSLLDTNSPLFDQFFLAFPLLYFVFHFKQAISTLHFILNTFSVAYNYDTALDKLNLKQLTCECCLYSSSNALSFLRDGTKQ